MIRIIFLLLLLISIKGFPQNLPKTFNDCEYEMFFAVVDEPETWAVDSISIADYFNQICSEKSINLDGANGNILLGIIIYEDGKPCCHSFANMTDKNLPVEEIKNIINEMPFWNPGKQKGNDVIVLNNLL